MPGVGGRTRVCAVDGGDLVAFCLEGQSGCVADARGGAGDEGFGLVGHACQVSCPVARRRTSSGVPPCSAVQATKRSGRRRMASVP